MTRASSGTPRLTSRATRVVLLRSGKTYFDALEAAITAAREEIHLQTYIFEPDKTGQRIIDALKAAAKRGVRVYLMPDAYGSSSLTGNRIAELRSAGINVQYYGRLFHRGRFHIGRRLHRKVVVVDGCTAIVGGINISEKYDLQEGHVPWLDYAVLVEGGVARRLRLICRQRWLNIRFRRKSLHIRHPRLTEPVSAPDGMKVQVTQNDFLRNKNETAISYRRAIRESKESLTFVGGYFLPGGRVRRLLRAARRRGVVIRLILAERSDVMISVFARQYLYRWLIRYGIKVFEYQPSNVHGKVLVADRRFVSIGSYDLNNLSTYSNIELNLSITDEGFAGTMQEALDEVILRDCREVDEIRLKQRGSWWWLLRCWISYRITKTLFGLSWLLARSRVNG